MCLVPLMPYSTSDIGVTLKSGSRAVLDILNNRQMVYDFKLVNWSAVVTIALSCTIF